MNHLESNIRKIYISKFLNHMFFFTGVLIPFFTLWGGITFTQVMILQSVYVVSIFFFEIPTGAVADKFGRKTSLILGALAMSVGIFCYSTIPNFWLFVLGEVLWALGAALTSGADEAIVYDSLKKLRKTEDATDALAKIRSYEMLALVISAPIGGYIASEFGIIYTMRLVLIPVLLGTIVLFFLKEPRNGISSKEKKLSYLDTIKDGVSYFRSHKTLRILAFDRISIDVLVVSIVFIYQELFQSLGVSFVHFGWIHASISLTQVIVLSNFSRVERYFASKKSFLTLSALISGISFILMGVISNIPVMVVLLNIIAAFGLTRYVFFKSIFNKNINSYHRATVLSTISMLNRMFRGLLFPIVGIMVDWSVKYSLLILGIAIIVFSMLSNVEEMHLKI